MTVVVHHEVAGAEPASEHSRPPATSRTTVITTLLGLVVALSLRASDTYHLIRQEMPSQMAEDINDPRLERLAIQGAVFIGVLLTVIAAAIFFMLARVLERHLFGARIGHGRVRVGLFGLTVVLCVLPYQLYALAVPPAEVRDSATTAARTLAAAVVATLVFLPQLRARGWVRAAGTGIAAVLLGLLTALG